MGRLVVTVTYVHECGSSACLSRDVIVSGPLVRTIRVRADTNTSSVAHDAVSKRLPLPTRFTTSSAAPSPSTFGAGRVIGTSQTAGRRAGLRLLGGYEENMLRGRLGDASVTSIPGFVARLSVAAAVKTPPTATVAFTASYAALVLVCLAIAMLDILTAIRWVGLDRMGRLMSCGRRMSG
jgi:hypothetical protein